MKDRFTDRTVFITGAGSGIGLQMALQFMAGGAKVYSADRDTSGCAEGTVKVLLDVTDEAQVIAGLRQAVEEAGRLDVLCNNAGASSITDPLSCTAEEWDKVVAVNARGVFLGTNTPSRLAGAGGRSEYRDLRRIQHVSAA